MKKQKKEVKKELLNQITDEQYERFENALEESYIAVGRTLPIDKEKRKSLLLDILVHLNTPIAEEYDENGNQKANRLNVYTDGEVSMITVEINTGVTPMMINHEETGRQLKSLAYIVPQDIEPAYEWYKPSKIETGLLEPKLRKHAQAGGLILRKLGEEFKPTFKQNIRRLMNKNLN